MWTCLVDVWSGCGKDSIWALGADISVLGVDLGFLEVEAHTRKLCAFFVVYGRPS